MLIYQTIISGSNCTISSWRNNAAHFFPLTIDVRTALLATVLKNIFFYCRSVSQSVNLDELSNRSQDLEAASRYLSAALLTSNISQGNLLCPQLPVKLACFHSLNALTGVRLSVRSAHTKRDGKSSPYWLSSKCAFKSCSGGFGSQPTDCD